MSDLSWVLPAGFDLPAVDKTVAVAPMYDIDYSGHATRKDGSKKVRGREAAHKQADKLRAEGYAFVIVEICDN
jgi:hypothetical protein